MNIIVTNQNKELINGANIEIMKELNGVFQISEIANSFNSIFYKKLIVDATALKDFPKENVLRELAKKFDTEKLILFLPPNNPPPKKFLALLVNLNIYNFTDNVKGLQNLIAKNNTYDDVKEYVIPENPNMDISNQSFDDLVNSVDTTNTNVILGIKDVTRNAGGTELTYMLKKCLESVHKKKVIALEIDKNEFVYYNEKNMYSIAKGKLKDFFNTLNGEIVIVDLGNYKNYDFCTDVIYLVEPSLYRINQLMMLNRSAFAMLKGKKIILNKCLLGNNDIDTFSREAGISIYYVLPPLNDRIFNPIMNSLLSKLGLIDVSDVEQRKNKRSFFDIFK